MCRAGVSTAGLYVFAEDVDFKNIGFDSSRALNLLVGQTPDKLYLQRIRQWKRRVLKHPHLGTWRKPTAVVHDILHEARNLALCCAP